MNIAMFTNTYLPHVGGVAQSVVRFARAYRRAGHDVLVVAPEFDGAQADEDWVARVPALQNFNGSDFSVVLPIPKLLSGRLTAFAPDIVHSHHPFLLGDTALRMAAAQDCPVVFTHHTLYERYTHYVPLDAPRLKDFVKELTVGYCNSCNAVIAPSGSIASLLKGRGVDAPIATIPSGVDLARFQKGSGPDARQRHGIPPQAPLAGFVSRLAPEKNLDVLCEAIAFVLREDTAAWFLAVGDGPGRDTMQAHFAAAGVEDRVVFTGILEGRELVDAYHAMDVFAFASMSETQGMVVAEAMAAGAVVAALDAPGVRDVVEDGVNGWLVQDETPEALGRAIAAALVGDPDEREHRRRAARKTAEALSTDQCAAAALHLYETVRDRYEARHDAGEGDRLALLKRIEEEWNLWRNRIAAANAMLRGPES